MSGDSNQFQELRLPAVGLELAACLWNPGAHTPFFALHGWLDNAASMEPLARNLPQLQVLAPDMAGHGHSDFRSTDSNYDLVKDVADINAMANHLRWEKFGLIGHSRGAMIAALFAATFPERISHLILLDGGAPLRFDCSERPARLARAIREQAILAAKQGSLFASREAALHARAKGYVPVDGETAELLAKRALGKEAEGFRWRADQRLKAGSLNPLDSQTIDVFFSAIRCPVLQIIGRDGLVVEREGPVIENTGFGGPVELIGDFERAVLAGGHHLHITEVGPVAGAIKAWLAKKSV